MNGDIIITNSNYQDATLTHWEMELGFIYSRKNNNRDPGNMWLRAVSDASKVGEAVRKGEYHEVMKYLTHTMAWILTTTHKLVKYNGYGGNPALLSSDGRRLLSAADVLFEKYPNICPYCGEGANCLCGVIRQKIENETKAQRRERLQMHRRKAREEAEARGDLLFTVPEFTQMFERIYGHTHYGVDIDKIAFHMLEEVGEVAWCLTSLHEGTRTKEDSAPLPVQLAEEIADTIAWSFAIISKLDNLYVQTKRLETLNIPNVAQAVAVAENAEMAHGLLPKYLWSCFEGDQAGFLRCPGCKERPCHCGL